MLQIGERLCLKSPWETGPVPAGRLGIILVPTIAFGDGTHPSTRLFLEQMEELVTPGMTVVDAGTGSGILSIAAIKLGAAKAYAIDASKMALMALSANLQANGMGPKQVEFLRATYEAVQFPPADLFLCNIPDIRPVLAGMEMAYGLLPSGGRFVNMPPVRDAAAVEESALAAGFTVARKIDDAKWAYRVFEKP